MTPDLLQNYISLSSMLSISFSRHTLTCQITSCYSCGGNLRHFNMPVNRHFRMLVLRFLKNHSMLQSQCMVLGRDTLPWHVPGWGCPLKFNFTTVWTPYLLEIAFHSVACCLLHIYWIVKLWHITLWNGKIGCVTGWGCPLYVNYGHHTWWKLHFIV
jgi:hypothetical protein